MEYVYEQIADAGGVSYRRMFGEYCVYRQGKVVGFVCDDQLFVKRTEAGMALLPGCPLAPPYKGATLYLLIEDLDDRELMADLIQATWQELPERTPRRKKCRSRPEKRVRREDR